MPYETPLTSFTLAPFPSSSSPPTHIVLQQQPESPASFVYVLTSLSPSSLRIFVSRADSPGTMEGALKRPEDLKLRLFKGIEVSRAREEGKGGGRGRW